MQRNLKKEKNNMFVTMICPICLDVFKGGDFRYKVIYVENGYACYNCVNQSEEEIIKRINIKIDHLEEQKKILVK